MDQNIRNFEKAMALLTKNFVSKMRSDILNNDIRATHYAENIAAEVQDVAEDFAIDCEDTLLMAEDAGKIRKRRVA